MSSGKDSGKTYHLSCTGDALETVNKHTDERDITLFGSCFCPFVQRVWVAFEYLGIPYKVNEVDPYKKPKDLLDVSPKGLVPGLKLNYFNPPRPLNESTVILEYLEDLAANTTGRTLLPSHTDPYARALVRLQADHVSRTLVPAFYRFLQGDETKQAEARTELDAALQQLIHLLNDAEQKIDAGMGSGLWSDSGELNWLDVMVAPWIFRASNVLLHYRAFELPEDPKFRAWTQRLFAHPAFKATTSTEDLYVDSYERYAYNRPNTSQVANAINTGRGLP
ncbi:glutathione S-transferase [Auriscalpium vulgare]|uniref:Glutathione S-transferase n=1 Tax=Auriscalpium vulgare TaxID=40419 RepID=A0ACB8RGR7_9AGAM|nr:glutathione S-transferase [Auriscalpium vulgare]